ncbi:MAG: GspE/PulE family protein [Verrucomicrobiota bacterium]
MTTADDFVLQLIEDNQLATAEQIAAARQQVEADGTPEGVDKETAILDRLVAETELTWDQVTATLAEEFNMEVVNLEDIRPDPEAMRLLSVNHAKRYRVFPLSLDQNEVELAICDPLDVDTVDNLSHVIGKSINTRLATPEGIEKAIQNFYAGGAEGEVHEMFAEMDEEDEDGEVTMELPTGDEQGTAESDAPIIRYVRMVITEALKRRASDIHMEPLEKRFRVRYRVDGVLQEVENPPKRLQPSITSRLKLMSNISIAEKRVPQDGRINIKVGPKVIDLRVSCLPTAYGESIVMRILDKEGLKLGLPQLGFFSDDQATFERIIGMPDGVFLVTGPTGSGKSTTLYSALNVINKPDRKIITVEDPVEYEMTGINQVSVRREVGMTFAAALRSMLRQAPNIIMVGEIRDLETAEIAINASLTGHMVFSTLHTNDAPSAVSRLVDIGVKPFLVSAALRAVLAQRLVRRIDPQNKEPYHPTPAELSSIGIREDQVTDANFMKGKPAPNNNGTGFRGRFGIFEMFSITEEIQTMIYENCTLVELRKKARDLGMRNMREDGIRKVMAGLTTISEVLHATVEEPTA